MRDEALCAIASACVHITQLDLSNCRRLTDVGVAALAALPLLQHLELTNCPGATDPNPNPNPNRVPIPNPNRIPSPNPKPKPNPN